MTSIDVLPPTAFPSLGPSCTMAADRADRADRPVLPVLGPHHDKLRR